jgi:hypothetical protein
VCAASAAALALASLLLPVATTARAQEPLGLAGTYTGTYVCSFGQGGDGAAETSRQSPSTLVVSELALSADGEQISLRIDDVAYDGRAFEAGGAGSGRGLASFARCAASGAADAAPRGAVQRVSWWVDGARGTGGITVDEIFAVASGAPGVSLAGTCEGRWTRISLDEPNLPPCE